MAKVRWEGGGGRGGGGGKGGIGRGKERRKSFGGTWQAEAYFPFNLD